MHEYQANVACLWRSVSLRSFSFFQVERTVLNVCATLAINKVKGSVTYFILDPRLMFREENYKRIILLNYWNMVKLIKKKGQFCSPKIFLNVSSAVMKH